MALFLIIYRFFYGILLFSARVSSFLNPKLREGFKLRKGKPWLNFDENSQALWIHCSSGEFEYAKPVIREIKQKWPQQKVLVTYFSPSVVKSLQNSPEVDFFCPLPWDKTSEWKEFIEFHKPKALLIARTDLWPNMIAMCKQLNVPTLLFSKTFNKNKGSFARWLEKSLIKKLSAVFCASEEDRALLATELRNYPEVHNAGDTRYDQCFYRLRHGKSLKPLNNFYRPIFIVGSSWDKDEETILPVIEKFNKDVSFIIAPHEPSEKHLKKLSKDLKKRGLEFCFYSKINSWNPTSVLIIDQVGILADLYAWASFSFIGGSMDRSVHSVMESLAQGCLTFVGPNHTNNREALVFQKEQVRGIHPVQVIQSSDELTENLAQHLDHWSAQEKHILQQEVQKKAGASQIVLKWISNNTDLH